MRTGSSLPYRLRPNKAVDRELFVSLLTRLASALSLEKSRYIGLGGSFLEDFRMVHARVGIQLMTCIEAEEEVHKRQKFNRPIASIECLHTTLEAYLDGQDFVAPVIIWFDYTQGTPVQIERFARSVGCVPVGSILRVTLNAHPESIVGRPDPDEISVEAGGDVSGDRHRKPTTLEWRFRRFREKLGALFPSGLTSNEMSEKNFGVSLLRALKLAVEKEALSFNDRKIRWALATYYKDGASMVTATIVICPPDDDSIESVLDGWEFRSTPEAPHRLDLPVLSTLERLTMEAYADPQSQLNFTLPTSGLGGDPVTTFKKFYRVYPHFSRVEL